MYTYIYHKFKPNVWYIFHRLVASGYFRWVEKKHNWTGSGLEGARCITKIQLILIWKLHLVHFLVEFGNFIQLNFAFGTCYLFGGLPFQQTFSRKGRKNFDQLTIKTCWTSCFFVAWNKSQFYQFYNQPCPDQWRNILKGWVWETTHKVGGGFQSFFPTRWWVLKNCSKYRGAPGSFPFRFLGPPSPKQHTSVARLEGRQMSRDNWVYPPQCTHCIYCVL